MKHWIKFLTINNPVFFNNTEKFIRTLSRKLLLYQLSHFHQKADILDVLFEDDNV